MRRFLPLACLLFAGLALLQPLRALERRPERSSPLDLAVKGLVEGLPKGKTGYLRWSDLATLPQTKLKITGEFIPGEQEVTVVFVSDLLKALPVKKQADAIVATCVDGFVSVFRQDFVARYRPFIVLEIAGVPSSAWPPKGITYNPGPYPITVSSKLVPEAETYRDIEHKKPWGVGTIEFVSYADEFKPIYSGRFTNLSPGAKVGREIWINSCVCCHAGPDHLVAGTKADRPYAVIQAYALSAPDYFKHYVRNPQDEASCAQMEAHPHYSDEELDDIVAFIAAGAPKA